MKTVWLTGGTGFIGKNISEPLAERYQVLMPTREEVDLLDQQAVSGYVEQYKPDIILHSANPNPVKNNKDQASQMLADSLTLFMHLYKMRESCERIIYLGSGAEYDKRRDLYGVSEEMVGKRLPVDSYGLGKAIMNTLARASKNVYNLRLFACYGPGDHESKFITHAIRCCMRGEPISIRQDCWFDYLHVSDLVPILMHMMKQPLDYADYNVCSGQAIRLGAIAEEVNRQMNGKGIYYLEEGMNKAYTGSCQRLKEAMGDWEPLSLEEGVRRQIEWERRGYNEKKSS